nr:uncharacterized protein LOC129386990 [Dermacentor andersoni]
MKPTGFRERLVNKPENDPVSQATSSQTPYRSSPRTSKGAKSQRTSAGATSQVTSQATPSTSSRWKPSSWWSAVTPKLTETRLQGEPDIPATAPDTSGTCLTAFDMAEKAAFQKPSANVKVWNWHVI